MAGARVGERLDGIYNIYLVRTTINYQLNYACVHIVMKYLNWPGKVKNISWPLWSNREYFEIQLGRQQKSVGHFSPTC